jgi:hypothetical protein
MSQRVRTETETQVMLQQSEDLRKAIENLMNATLHDALARPDGLLRVIAHRRTGTAS